MLAEHFLQLGDRRIDLLSTNFGYNIEEYKPGHLQMKGGGNYHDSAMSDFRKLIDYRWGTITDIYTLKQFADCTDELIRSEQEFERGLIDAINYWKVSWHTTPGYIVRRAKGETNRAYSLVYGYRFYDNNNPYRPPFWGEGRSKYIQLKLKLAIEHGPWLSLPPGQSSALELASCFCQNLIVNPSMENWTGLVLDNWTRLNIGSKDILEETTLVYEGGSSAQILAGGGAKEGIYQQIDELTIGAQYTITARIYVESGDEVYIFIAPSGSTTQYASSTGTKEARWVEETVTFAAQGTTIRLIIATSSAAGATVYYVDDIHFDICSGTVVIDDDRYMPLSTTDDAHIETTGSVIDLGTTLQAGNAGANVLDLGVRFRNVQVPKNATIDSAYIRFVAATTQTMTGISLRIFGEDTANPAEYSTYADFTGRVLTTADVVWAPSAWVAGTTEETPDIKTIVQEIVNLGAWATGNNMAIQVQDDGGDPRIIDAYSTAGAGSPPMLVIEYDGGSVSESPAVCEKTTDPVYITNAHKFAGLTHIYQVDAVDSPVSGNLLDLPPGYELFRMPGVLNMGVIFGISTAHPGSNPFDNVVFDLLTGASSTTSYTITWQVSDGAGGWITLTNFRDDTSDLSETGVSSISWMRDLTAIMGTDTYNGITAWWLKAKITALTGTFTSPVVQNRHPYTITSPYIEIDENDVLGDISSLSKLSIINKNFRSSAGQYVLRVIGGLRTVSRGTEFSAYLPFSDTINHDFVSCAVSGTDTSFVASDTSATGRAVNYAYTVATTNYTTLTIYKPYSNHFIGKFRVYLRLSLNVYVSGITVRLSSNWGHYLNAIEISAGVAPARVIDFGEINLPAWPIHSDLLLDDLVFQVDFEGAATADIDLTEIILIPVDELILDSMYGGTTVVTGASTRRYLTQYTDIGETGLYIDSVSNPKNSKLSNIKRVSNEKNIDVWPINASAPIGYQPNTTQRIWFFQFHEAGIFSAYFSAPPEINGVLQSANVDRYSGFKGSR